MTTWVREDLVSPETPLLKDNAIMVSPGVDETEPDHPAWVRVKEMHDRGDFDKIDRIVVLWDSFETLGKVGRFLRWIVIKLAIGIAWAAGLLASYGVLSGEMQKWLAQK